MHRSDPRPLVSVVIPCHNHARVLGGAVRSATARASRVQVIVVDDGSTDGTAAAARGLDVVFMRQATRGLAAARNRGLAAATGEFVIFLDPDDRFLPGGIDTAVRALASAPDAAMAYGRGVADGAKVLLVRTGHHAALLQTNLIWMTAAAIFRRTAIERAGGFAEGFDGAADYDLYLRLSRDSLILDHGRPVAACGRDAGARMDAERLLRDTLLVMRRHRPDPGAPLYAAWREGYARWQEVYGTPLADEIRAHLHARELADAWRKAIALVSLAPGVFARTLGRRERDDPSQRVANKIALPPPSSNLPSSII